MLRILGIISLLTSAALFYLVRIDRQSVPALDVVELQGQIGAPLWALAAGLGVVLLFLARPRRATPLAAVTRPGAPRPANPPKSAPFPVSTEGWLAALLARARSMPLEPGASVEIDPHRTPPVQLLLDRVTPERARRSVEAFAELLASMPTPPRAAITFQNCPPGGAPRPQSVTAAVRRYLPRDRFNVTSHEDTVEISFGQPDPRWDRV